MKQTRVKDKTDNMDILPSIDAARIQTIGHSGNISFQYILSTFLFNSSEGRTRKRRRTTEVVDIEDRLESLITRVGEKVCELGFYQDYCFATCSTKLHQLKEPSETSGRSY